MGLERWEVKVLCMFGLFLSMAIFVLLPIKVSKAVAKQGKRGLLIISVLSCFGGGVFFGAYLLHMSPEVRELLEDALLIPQDIYFPLPELFAGLGFFLILFMEKFVMLCRDSSLKKEENVTAKSYEVNVAYAVENGKEKHNGLTPMPGFEELKSPGSCHTPRDPDIMSIASTTKLGALDAMAGDEEAQTRSIIFMIAMSLDCIFEGMAMGLMTSTQDVIDIFVAIISHEFIMSFCIGLELVKYHRTKYVVLGGLFYAFTPVIGAVIGICIVEIQTDFGNQNTIDIVTGVLQSMSAGTFIYCSFLGILKDNLDNDHGILKSVVVLLGFGLMAGMAAIPSGIGASDVMTTEIPNMMTTV